ncbi:signal peptide peptidase A. Serine peptidase. MEROPS family S49 [Thermosyntropha lipolytica DSM 11003]|uniref:Signal peptide peptidase A. Serine peptidase. MEROPS family S49 n=1 Tax=Thermosyntropha lipolytica DSM 11003 TaxID=1123382 RepID=A0A1M5PZI2_9FIRM|nr:signal peptide peptidase SppA [Thermosyntropha lipolytica]SHH07086.1 signal peptide peptidase A. Serine peptidase. MEROPS family S49 [Thermosyntropha lipolytica DSM 11003]
MVKKRLVVVMMVVFLLVVGGVALKNSSQGGKITSKGEVVGVINIDGPITGSSTTDIMGTGGVSALDIMEKIKTARQRPDIKAVVIRINSPGGTAAASQEIAEELDKLRKEGKPVVTSMGDMCASGGYWLACSTDYIMANGGTLTGSIGVIMQIANLEELYRKLGIEMETIKSGKHKDIGSSSRALTEEERKLLQDLIDDSYNQFLEQVKKGRKGKISEEELLKIADGRIFSGRQALELGLVDGLGNYYDAIRQAEKMAGIKEGTAQVEILNQPDFWSRLGLSRVKIDNILFQDKWIEMR